MISSRQFVKACTEYKYDTIPNNFIHTDYASIEQSIFGEGCRMYFKGSLPYGRYLYLYLDEAEQNDLYDTIAKIVEEDTNPDDLKKGFVDALGVTADRAVIAVIGVA